MKINIFLTSLGILNCLLTSMPGFGEANDGSISGMIADVNGKRLDNVNIVVLGTPWGAVSDSNGNFLIEHVKPGKAALKIMRIGYRSETIDTIQVLGGETVQLSIILTETVLPMPEIVVTPGIFSIAEGQAAKLQAIEKERIMKIPATLDDIYRVLQMMPGVTFSDDFSAHFHVRGGKQNENLILLDGIEVYDPYHLKDIGGAVGVMNMEMIDHISIMTGGFEARYGDRISSVVCIENRAGPFDRFGGSLVAGGTGLSLLLKSPIPGGGCIVSYRKSLLKEAAEMLNPTSYTFSPSYYDVQSKIAIAPNNNHQIAVTFLYSKDKSYLEKWRDDSDIYSNYGNSYQGIVWKTTPSTHLISELIISRGENFWDNRIEHAKEEKLNLIENTLNWNVTVHPTRFHEIGAGLTFKQISYCYEITAPSQAADEQVLEDLIASYFGSRKISPRTSKLAFYLQDKFQLFKPLNINIGLRYDAFDYNQDQQVSPRIGISYHFENNTIIRAAWGNYYQAPSYTELTETKGAEYNPHAQKSTHYVLGIEKFLTEKFSIRIESYLKTLEQMIGHYFEMDEPSGQFELRYGNPHSGTCRGIEAFINGQVSDHLSIWAAYAYSRATIETYFVNWTEKRLEKYSIPRFTDQPHNFSLFLTYKLSNICEIDVKWRYLSGIPYTPLYSQFTMGEPHWIYGDYYSARYPSFHRLDIRIGRQFTFKKYQLTTFLEIKNLYNRKNVLLYDYLIKNDQPVRRAYYTLPFLPTIEFKISF